jgi:hypothetical protein
MSTQTTTSGYMLLFRGTHWDKILSPEEIQGVMSRWTAWFDRLTQEGKAKAGQPLTNEGKASSRHSSSRAKTEGPGQILNIIFFQSQALRVLAPILNCLLPPGTYQQWR